MANISPNNLILRCYGYRTRKGNWYGVCLNFDIAVEAEDKDHLKRKMHDVLVSYVESVKDTEDNSSIPFLLSRRSPIKDWLIYYGIRLLVFLRDFPNNFTFEDAVPFHLAHER